MRLTGNLLQNVLRGVGCGLSIVSRRGLGGEEGRHAGEKGLSPILPRRVALSLNVSVSAICADVRFDDTHLIVQHRAPT